MSPERACPASATSSPLTSPTVMIFAFLARCSWQAADVSPGHDQRAHCPRRGCRFVFEDVVIVDVLFLHPSTHHDLSESPFEAVKALPAVIDNNQCVRPEVFVLVQARIQHHIGELVQLFDGGRRPCQ